MKNIQNELNQAELEEISAARGFRRSKAIKTFNTKPRFFKVKFVEKARNNSLWADVMN